MEFRCRLGTPGGDIIEGVYVADNEARLRRELEEKGLYVLAIERAGALGLGSLSFPSRRKISSREFLVFNQELATLLKAGMPLVQSLEILRRRVSNPVLKAVLDDVHERVRSGNSLSEAFEAHGSLFPGVYTASLMAGEKSGSLEQVIRRYVAYVKVVSGVRRKTISALVYPGILLALSLVVVAIIVLKVVPEFGLFYEQSEAQLPWSTRFLVSVSNFAGAYLLLLLATAAAVVFAAWTWLNRAGNRVRFDRWLTHVPLVGPISQKFATSQAARTLATLLGGGIPLVNAIDVSARSIQNRHIASELQNAAQQVREGRALALAMNDSGAFPDVAIKMVEVGEQTGALQEMLNSLADFYDEDIETEVARFITLIEPVILVIMGVVIAAVVLALYMPLFELSSVVGG
jgi:type IV pilus assembly protein PilC